MITRRSLLAASAVSLAVPAVAQDARPMPKPGKRDWAAQVPVMRIGLLGGENDADRLARVDGYKKLMETTFEVPVKLLVAADYAGVIQAFAAKQLETAYMSPAAYAAAWLESNGDVVPLVVTQEQDGSNSYVSVMYVRADSGITVARRDEGAFAGLGGSEQRLGLPDPARRVPRAGHRSGARQVLRPHRLRRRP